MSSSAEPDTNFLVLQIYGLMLSLSFLFLKDLREYNFTGTKMIKNGFFENCKRHGQGKAHVQHNYPTKAHHASYIKQFQNLSGFRITLTMEDHIK